jgi:hypothetical protein
MYASYQKFISLGVFCLSLLYLERLDFLQSTLFSYKEPGSLPLPRVALAVKCTQSHLLEWESLIAALPLTTRANLTLFFTIYGTITNQSLISISKNIPLLTLLRNYSNLSPTIIAHLAPTSTLSWTPGRNELLQIMYAYEVDRGERFTYWVTADGDTSHIDCNQCLPTRPPDYSSTACCWDTLLGSTLNADGLSFAMVGTMLSGEELPFFGQRRKDGITDIHQYLLKDCTDGQIQAFHRDAVPLLLPFHDEFEDQSWWASQYLLFAYTSACVRGSIAVLEGNLRVWDNEHTLLQARLPPTHVMHDFIARENPDLFGQVIFTDRQCLTASNIRNNPQDSVIYLVSGEDVGETVSNIPVIPRVRWNETCAFSQCFASRNPKFIETIGKGVPEAPRRKEMKVGWVWGWQALDKEPILYWSEKTKLSGFSENC